MSLTSGSLANSSKKLADLTKEATSYDIVVPAATNAAQVVDPKPLYDGFTVYNKSSLYDLRGTITFSATIVSATTAAERTFVVPPLATFSADFSDQANDAATGSAGAIDSISFQALEAPTATGLASARVAPATLKAAVIAQINFVHA